MYEPNAVRVSSAIGSAASDVQVGRAVLVGVDGRIASGGSEQIDVGVGGGVAGDARTDLENACRAVRKVLQAMTVAIARLEPGGVTGAKPRLGRVESQRNSRSQSIRPRPKLPHRPLSRCASLAPTVDGSGEP